MLLLFYSGGEGGGGEVGYIMAAVSFRQVAGAAVSYQSTITASVRFIVE